MAARTALACNVAAVHRIGRARGQLDTIGVRDKKAIRASTRSLTINGRNRALMMKI